MRALIYGSTLLVVAFSLFLFDDVEIGLPLVSLIVWTAVLLAGLLLVLRAHKRRQYAPRARSTRTLPGARSSAHIAARRKTTSLPRR